jgi:hypothetical protein
VEEGGGARAGDGHEPLPWAARSPSRRAHRSRRARRWALARRNRSGRRTCSRHSRHPARWQGSRDPSVSSDRMASPCRSHAAWRASRATSSSMGARQRSRWRASRRGRSAWRRRSIESRMMIDGFLRSRQVRHRRKAASAPQERIGLDLDQHERIDQRLDLDHRSRRTNVAKIFAVRASVLLPAGDVGHEHPRAHDVRH